MNPQPFTAMNNPNPSSTFGISHDMPAEVPLTSTRGHFWNPNQLAHRAHDQILEPAINAVRHVRENASTRLHDAEAALGQGRDRTMAWSSAHPCQTMMTGFLAGLLCGALIARRGW